MPNVTSEQIASLVKLQQIEIETRDIETNLGQVDERLGKLDGKLLDFKKVIEQQESVIQEFNRQYRTYESDAQMNLDRIKKSEAKLISVKTNKEYQASLKEIDDLKETNSKLEDNMIELLDRIEEAENALKEKTAEYADLGAQVKTEKERIQKEAAAGRHHLGNLDAQGKTVSASIEAELLATFNRIKADQSNQVGIAAVEDAVCQGCHMNIPPQMYNELLRGDQLKRCPICERIIYCQEQKKRSE